MVRKVLLKVELHSTPQCAFSPGSIPLADIGTTSKLPRHDQLTARGPEFIGEPSTISRPLLLLLFDPREFFCG